MRLKNNMAVTVVGKDISVVHRTICENCASVLDFLWLDVVTKQSTCMGDLEIWYAIQCPDCKSWIEVTRGQTRRRKVGAG